MTGKKAVVFTASLTLFATWLSPWAANGQKRYVTWPPPEVFSNQPRYDVSMPYFNPSLGPTDELGSYPRTRDEDRPFIRRYRQANRSYQAGLHIMLSQNPDYKRADSHFRTAYVKYLDFLRHRYGRDYRFRNPDSPSTPTGLKKRRIPHDTSKYMWRLRQMAAASLFNMGISSAVMEAAPSKLKPRQYYGPRDRNIRLAQDVSAAAVSAILSNKMALGLYDALKSRKDRRWGKVYTLDPRSPPVANEDDLRFIARAYNNLGAALVRQSWAQALLEMSSKYLPVTLKDGRLSMPTPDFRRWLRQAPWYLSFLDKAAGLFTAALKQEPANELYFQNLFLALSRRHAALAALGDPRAESCLSLLKKMKNAMKDRGARVRLTASIQKSNPCLAFPDRPPAVVSPGQKGPPPKGTGQPDRPPATASPGQKRPPPKGTGQPDRPPAAGSPGQKRPPLKGKGQKVKPPPRCGPGLANQTDCVRKRMEGH